MGSSFEMSPPVHRMSPRGQRRGRILRRTVRLHTRRVHARQAPHLLCLLALAVASALWNPGPVRAQRLSESIEKRIVYELERTDRIIERAGEALGSSAGVKSNPLLDNAVDIQRKAWLAYRANPSNPAALKMTMEARDLARRALESAEIDVKSHESIRDLIDSTKELIDRARPMVDDRGDRQSKRLLENGIWQLDRAQDAYRAADYRKAIRLGASARDLVQRALQRARSGVAAEPVGIDTALERTDMLIEDLKGSLQGRDNPLGRSLLERAIQLQDRARGRAEGDRPGMALKLTMQARQAALDGLLELAKDPGRADVERAVAVVDEYALDLAPEIEASRSKDALSFLDSARQRLVEARDLLGKGEMAAAIEQARIAEGLLRRAAETADIR
jgi:hypothetical protein